MTDSTTMTIGQLLKLVKEVRQRMVRVESRVTSFMRYNGFRPGVDLKAKRVERVFIDPELQEVHVSTPDAPIGMILDGVLDTDIPSFKLFVSGVQCGTIEPSQPIEEKEHE